MPHRIEQRLALTAAEITAGLFSVEVIDTSAAPNQAKKRITGPRLLQSTQRALQEITTNSTVGAAAITLQAGTVKVTAAGVAAMTLAAPTAAQEGMEIYVVSTTANAHTITATGLIDDGVTGGSKTTATFAAFAGAGIVLQASNLKWAVKSLKAVTIS